MHTYLKLFALSCIFISIQCKRKQIKCPELLNYTGKLHTLRGNEYALSNISIAHKQQCIPVYRAPCNTDTIITNLSYNPKDHVVHLDLTDIKEIEIPYPYAIWIFKAPCHKGKNKYLLIKVMWNNKNKSPEHFLIEPRRRLTASVHKKVRTAYRHIPFSGFKKISIADIEK